MSGSAKTEKRGGGPRVFLSAGEPSGDQHGAALARALRRSWPDAELYGLGGDQMAEAGVTLHAHTRDLAVMGLVEVLKHLPFFVGLWGAVKGQLEDAPPDLVIPIDYPGFNLRLARRARLLRIPVLYFIAPQVWAWHRSRMRELAANVDRLAVVLPFEEALFREAGANVRFVGHPLIDVHDELPGREAFCASLNLAVEQPILALFPGSRLQEVERHLPLFGRAVERVRALESGVQPVVAATGTVTRDIYEQAGIPYTHDPRALLANARAALVKSGTTTLQTGLAGVPMVVTYQMHPLTFQVAKHLVDVPHVALVNLVAGERVVPELIQDDATPETLAAALLRLLREGEERTRVVADLARVRAQLAGDSDGLTTAERVSALAAELLGQART
jgi:lipid-A-disaccharide synthase